MKKTTVKKHSRKTKKGRVKVRVHSRKIKGGVISKKELSVFNPMRTLPHEYGGEIDIGRDRKVERFSVYPGGSDYVDIDPDFEVLYHFHTPSGFPEPPSPEDLITLLKSKVQQAEIIFSGDTTYIIIPTNKSNKLRRLPVKKLKTIFDKLWIDAINNSQTPNEVEKRYLSAIRKEGFIIKRNTNPNKPIHVPVEIFERSKK